MTRTFLSVEISPELKRTLKERAAVEGGTVSALVCRTLANASKRWHNNGAPGRGSQSATSTAVRSESNGTTIPRARKRRAYD